MSTHVKPFISVGLPVYNGANYLAVAIESVLAQTFRDLELVISDNASTDETQEICESFARRDSRVRYFRQPVNRGAGFNYNFVFHRSRGRYFRWLAHDDYIAPSCLSACVALLNSDMSLVLAYTHHVDVNELGIAIRTVSRTKGQDDDVSKRFWDLMDGLHTCEEIFGLIRSDTLARSRLIADYTDSDRTLLGELSLYGKFGEVREVLFYHRLHAKSSVKIHPTFRDRAVWFNPNLKGRLVLSAWRQFYEMIAAIRRAPLGRVPKSQCYWQAIRWFKWRWRWMFSELFLEIRDFSRRSFARFVCGGN
jgi:glycosyltransferase involved in cell wall biosynthesis